MMTSNYSYLVIDDDLKVCESIRKRMQKYENWHCKGLLTALSETILLVEKERPDLLFLDWSIKGGNAFTLLERMEQFENYHPFIIFFTGYQNDHPEIPVELINRFKINRYLVKPIFEDLTNHLQHYIEETEKFVAMNTNENSLWITTTNKQKIKLDANQIICISQSRSNSRNKIIHTSDKKTHEFKAAWELCEKLARQHQFDYFFANSRDTMINRKYITKIQKPFLWLNDSIKVEVTKERWKELEP